MQETRVYEDRMAKAIANFERELNTIRAGRANPAVLDRILVDNYGVPTPINQIGNISVVEGTQLLIQPWDSKSIKAIEKAIQASDLGINPSSDGKVIRLVFPSPTEERRQELSKEAKKKGEEAKIAIRNIRRDAMDDFKKAEKKSDITKDDLKLSETEMQKITDKRITEIDKIVEAKTKDIMSL